MKRHAKKLTQSQFRLPALLFALIFAGLGVYILGFSKAATSVTISLTPSTSTVSTGSNFSVTVVENSVTSPVSALSTLITYDSTKLQFVSSVGQTTDPGFTTQVENDGTVAGVVKLSRGSLANPLTGSQNVTVLTFKALTPGPATLTVADPCATTAQTGCSTVVDNNSAGTTNLLTTVIGGTYTINDATAPTTPTGLGSSGVSATSATLSWTASTDNVAVTSYNVYRGGTKIASPTTNSYTNTGLTPSTAYSYTVEALDAAGNVSARSVALGVTTPADTTAPTLPSGLSASGITATSVTLSWTASTDNVAVTSYKVYRNGTNIASPTTNTYTNTGLTPGTVYSYTVQAVDAAGNASAQTGAVSATTVVDTQAPTVPTALTAPSKTNTSVTLNWTGSTDNIAVAGYNIYRNGTKVGTSATTSFTNTGLTPGSTHSFTVQAYDAANNTSAQTSGLSVSLAIKAGDINADDVVDLSDLTILAGNFNRTSATRAQGDLNGDGTVNIFDFGVLAGSWGK